MSETMDKYSSVDLSLEAMRSIRKLLQSPGVEVISFGGTPEQIKRDSGGNYLVDLRLTVQVLIPKEAQE